METVPVQLEKLFTLTEMIIYVKVIYGLQLAKKWTFAGIPNQLYVKKDKNLLVA